MAIPVNSQNASAGRRVALLVFAVAIAGIAVFVVFGKVSVTGERSVEVDIVAPTEHVPPKVTSDE